jgi:hypothetical protein
MKIGFTIIVALVGSIASVDAITPSFRFDRDTFAFANMTVFEYENGIAHLRRGAEAKQRRYTRRCFVLSRTAIQFHKFACFDPHAPPLDDRALVQRIRMVTTRPVWREPLPGNKRVVFPGYANLREMSNARGLLLQETVGHGWPTYWRVGNYRMLFVQSRSYQEQTHANLEAALARGELFAVYLTTLPQKFTLNHAVVVFAKQKSDSSGRDNYLVYDSHHPEKPRHLWWSERDHAFGFEKDWDFVGGYARAYQIYGKPLQ